MESDIKTWLIRQSLLENVSFYGFPEEAQKCIVKYVMDVAEELIESVKEGHVISTRGEIEKKKALQRLKAKLFIRMNCFPAQKTGEVIR